MTVPYSMSLLILALVTLVPFMVLNAVVLCRSRGQSRRYRVGYIVASDVPCVRSKEVYPEYASSCVICSANVVYYIRADGTVEKMQRLKRGDAVLNLSSGAVSYVSASGRLVRESGNAHVLICKSNLISVDPCVLDIPCDLLSTKPQSDMIRCVLPTFDYLSKSMMKSQKEYSREAA